MALWILNPQSPKLLLCNEVEDTVPVISRRIEDEVIASLQVDF